MKLISCGKEADCQLELGKMNEWELKSEWSSCCARLYLHKKRTDALEAFSSEVCLKMRIIKRTVSHVTDASGTCVPRVNSVWHHTVILEFVVLAASLLSSLTNPSDWTHSTSCFYFHFADSQWTQKENNSQGQEKRHRTVWSRKTGETDILCLVLFDRHLHVLMF